MALDDDILEEVRQYAEIRSISMGRAASDILRRGLHNPIPTRIVNGIRVFAPGTADRPITPEKIKELDEQDELERYHRAFQE